MTIFLVFFLHKHKYFLETEDTDNHRRRTETEGKSKVVVSVWGTKFFQFLAALIVLSWSIWKKQLNSTVSSK